MGNNCCSKEHDIEPGMRRTTPTSQCSGVKNINLYEKQLNCAEHQEWETPMLLKNLVNCPESEIAE